MGFWSKVLYCRYTFVVYELFNRPDQSLLGHFAGLLFRKFSVQQRINFCVIYGDSFILIAENCYAVHTLLSEQLSGLSVVARYLDHS